MNEYLIYAGAAVLALVALNSLVRAAAKRRRSSKSGRAVEELHIAVKVDSQEAMDELRKLCDEARQLQELIDGRTVQSLATIALSAGDTVVLMTDKLLLPQQRASIADRVQAKLPDDVRVMVLDGGLKIAALTKAQAPA